MSDEKLPLEKKLVTALEALPQDADMQHTITVLNTLSIPNDDYVNALMFIEILWGYKDLNTQSQNTQLLLGLRDECAKEAEKLRLKS